MHREALAPQVKLATSLCERTKIPVVNHCAHGEKRGGSGQRRERRRGAKSDDIMGAAPSTPPLQEWGRERGTMKFLSHQGNWVGLVGDLPPRNCWIRYVHIANLLCLLGTVNSLHQQCSLYPHERERIDMRRKLEDALKSPSLI